MHYHRSFNALQINAVSLLLFLLLLPLSVVRAHYLPLPDFAQDYAAAWGVLHGHSAQAPTASLLYLCCPTIPPYDLVMQTAHPPSATLISMPFALLPWGIARWAWLLVGWLVIGASWWLLRLPSMTCLATLPYWSLALSVGAIEPVLFGVLALAVVYKNRPVVAGAALGVAIALKVYPALLVLALIFDQQWRLVMWAALAAVGSWLVGEWITRATLEWLAYVPYNTSLWINSRFNYSLVRIVLNTMPSLPIAFITLFISILLIVPLLPRVRSGDIRVLVPVMMIASPIFWAHYIGLLSLHPIGKRVGICMFIPGVLLWFLGIAWITADVFVWITNSFILITMSLVWYQHIAVPPVPAMPESMNAANTHS